MLSCNQLNTLRASATHPSLVPLVRIELLVEATAFFIGFHLQTESCDTVPSAFCLTSPPFLCSHFFARPHSSCVIRSPHVALHAGLQSGAPIICTLWWTSGMTAPAGATRRVRIGFPFPPFPPLVKSGGSGGGPHGIPFMFSSFLVCEHIPQLP